MEIDPNAVIAALGQQVGALAADNARLRVGLDTAEAELTKVTRERDEAQQTYQDRLVAPDQPEDAVHLVPGEVV